MTSLCPFCGVRPSDPSSGMCEDCRSVQLWSPKRLNPLQRGKKTCAGCGQEYWNEGWHLENECSA